MMTSTSELTLPLQEIDSIQSLSIVPYSVESAESSTVCAFTSQPFLDRISMMTKRIMEHRAESGFEIVIDSKNQLIFGQLNLGGTYRDATNILYGMETKTSTSMNLLEAFDNHYNDEMPKILANFHSHPTSSPFSGGDIEVYEDMVMGSSPVNFKRNIHMWHGVIIPQFHSTDLGTDRVKGDRMRILESIVIFMFQGPPQNNRYQQENFSELSLEKQQELLEQCGMRTLLVPVHLIDQSLDFSQWFSAVAHL